MLLSEGVMIARPEKALRLCALFTMNVTPLVDFSNENTSSGFSGISTLKSEVHFTRVCSFCSESENWRLDSLMMIPLNGACVTEKLTEAQPSALMVISAVRSVSPV